MHFSDAEDDQRADPGADKASEHDAEKVEVGEKGHGHRQSGVGTRRKPEQSRISQRIAADALDDGSRHRQGRSHQGGRHFPGKADFAQDVDFRIGFRRGERQPHLPQGDVRRAEGDGTEKGESEQQEKERDLDRKSQDGSMHIGSGSYGQFHNGEGASGG